MEVNLTKEMVIHMLKGSEPDPTRMQPLHNFVTYSDQYGRYYWNTGRLKEMSTEELFELYKRCEQ